MFGWAKNAPGITMPPNVGFRIGGNGGNEKPVKYIVVQVHYAKKLDPGVIDYSGVDLTITKEKYVHCSIIYSCLATIAFHLDCFQTEVYRWNPSADRRTRHPTSYAKLV